MIAVHEQHVVGEGDFTGFLKRIQELDSGGINTTIALIEKGDGTPGKLIATIRRSPVEQTTLSERH